MSPSETPASLADTQPPRTKQAANEQKAADNRARAQQNRERAANNRTQKPSASDQDGQHPAPKAPPTSASAQPSKKPARRDAAKPAATRQAKASTHFKSKVVIRRLPPNLPEAVFWKVVLPWIRDAADCQPPASDSLTSPSGEASASTSSASALTPTVDFKQFIPGKLKTDASKQNKHARAYVRFLDANALVLFHKHFDGHIFRDSKARETVAIVEFAPYQKVVPARGRRSKPDPKQGTIETDADYLAFVERLSKAGEDDKRAEGDLLASTYDPRERAREREAAAAAGKSTPLLEHLRAVKQAKLESAALAKKAKKAERAAAKAAAKTADGAAATATQPAEPANKKAKKGKRHRTKEKLAAVDAAHVGGGKEIEAASKEPSKREKKGRQRKGKGRADGVDANAANTDTAPRATTKPESAKKQGNPAKDAPNTATATPARNPKQAGGRPAKKKPDAKAPAAENKADAGVAEGDGSTRKKPPRRKGGAKASTKPPSASTATAPASQPKLQILKREPAP
jgi:regulator of nonsense transcripts 3